MKTDFAILWIDDNKPFVDSLIPQLTNWMDTLGFGFTVFWNKGETGIWEDLKNKDIELIVIDYKLPRKKGDELIAEIRKNNYYHDIIFYSQGGISDSLFPKPPDGVFFVERGDANDRIKDIIFLKVRRASDLATLRGWIVADAIILENILGEILTKCFKGNEGLFKKRILLKEGLFDFGKIHSVLNGIVGDKLDQLQKSNPKSETFQKLDACKKILDTFPDEIIIIRNTLAHEVAEVTDTGDIRIKERKGINKTKYICFTTEKCIEIRKNIIKHTKNLLELAPLIENDQK